MDDRQSHVFGASASWIYSSDSGEILAHFRCETFTHTHIHTQTKRFGLNSIHRLTVEAKRRNTQSVVCHRRNSWHSFPIFKLDILFLFESVSPYVFKMLFRVCACMVCVYADSPMNMYFFFHLNFSLRFSHKTYHRTDSITYSVFHT